MYRVDKTHRWRGKAQRNIIPIWLTALTMLILDLKELNYLKKERKEKKKPKKK